MIRALVLVLSGCTVTPEDPTDPTVPEPLPPQCTDVDGIHHVVRPLYPDDPASPTFQYAVRLEAGTDPSLPVVIYVPGGPGGTSIADGRDTLPIPAELSVLYTEPRGVGCNRVETIDDPAGFFGTERFADDILTAVADLGIDEIVIYGHSYGTLLGTVTASLAEERGIAVRAVLLEGVVGGPFRGDADITGYQAEWEKVKAQLPVAADLLSQPTLPLGFDGEAWGDFLHAYLPFGGITDPYYGPVNFVSLQLVPLEIGADTTALEAAVAGATAAAQVIDPDQALLYEAVACHELADSSFFGVDLVDGALVPLEDACADVEVDTYYDVADWPIAAPITYLQGTADPNTPVDQARAHVDAQPGSDRSFVEVQGAGHQPFFLNLRDCAPGIWEGILAGSGPLLDACSWPTTLSTTPAGR